MKSRWFRRRFKKNCINVKEKYFCQCDLKRMFFISKCWFLADMRKKLFLQKKKFSKNLFSHERWWFRKYKQRTIFKKNIFFKVILKNNLSHEKLMVFTRRFKKKLYQCKRKIFLSMWSKKNVLYLEMLILSTYEEKTI